MREISTVLVTGASGFVGRDVESVLRTEKFYRVFSFLRASSDSYHSSFLGCRVLRGEIDDRASLDRVFEHKLDAIIHLVGIIAEEGANTFERAHVESTRLLVEYARQHGVKKFVHMSAIGARRDAPSRYHRTKFQAEELVRESGIPFTVLRPSVIFGTRCQFLNLLVDLVKFPRWTPIIGDGQGKLQPVWVRDVARMFAAALTDEGTDGRTYDVGGPKVYAFEELLTVLEKHLKREKVHWHLPVGFGELMVKAGNVVNPIVRAVLHRGSAELLAERLLPPPLNEDQLQMLQESHTCEVEPVEKAFGSTLEAFEDWLSETDLEEPPWKPWKPRYKGEGPTHQPHAG